MTNEPKAVRLTPTTDGGPADHDDIVEPNAAMWLPATPFLWPLFVAASTSELAGSVMKWCGDALAGHGDNTDTIALGWTTPNSVLLELASMQLRDFSAREIGQPTLVCAPYSLHAATIADFAQGHSVVEALRQSGVSRVF